MGAVMRWIGIASSIKFSHQVFFLFADNGIDHPCHSYGYTFGIAAFVLEKKFNFSTILRLLQRRERVAVRTSVKQRNMRERVREGALKIKK